VGNDVQQNSGEEVEAGVMSGVSSLAEPKSISFTTGPDKRMFSGWCTCVGERRGRECTSVCVCGWVHEGRRGIGSD